MALARVGWYDDGRFENTFPSTLFAAPGRIRHPDGSYELSVFVTNQDTNSWEISGENGGMLTYRLASDSADTRKTAASLNLAHGELVILFAPAHTTPAGVGGFLTINAEANACDVAKTAARQRLIVLDVFVNRVLADTNEPYSEDTRLSLRSNAQILRGLARELRNDFNL